MTRTILLFAALLPSLALGQNLVVNGSFEMPIVSSVGTAPGNPFDTYFSGQSFDGWNVGTGSVDVVDSVNLSAFEGVQTLDLAGETPGSVFQDISTEPGQDYLLRFALSGNPGTAVNPVKTVRVTFGDFVFTDDFDTTGQDFNSLDYRELELPIAGSLVTSGVTRLTFEEAGTGAGFSGPVIDDVQLLAVPEPLSIALLLVGFAGFCCHRR